MNAQTPPADEEDKMAHAGPRMQFSGGSLMPKSHDLIMLDAFSQFLYFWSFESRHLVGRATPQRVAQLEDYITTVACALIKIVSLGPFSLNFLSVST